MMRVLFLSIFIALSVLGVADTVRARNQAVSREGKAFPALNIEAGCRDVAHNDLNKTRDFPGCVSEERKAREQLRKEWASYPADMHGRCIHLVTPPALPNYVTLQECLRMARDAKNMTKTNGAAEIGNTMQAPSGRQASEKARGAK